jgi:hypothetical protein
MNYPNISLCGFQCEYCCTNYNILITECKCSYKETEFILFDYTLNALADESINAIQNIYITSMTVALLYYENMKLTFLGCFKNVFMPKLFIINIGGIIISILLIIDIVCVILLIKKGFFRKINNFLRLITEAYLKYLKRKKKEIKKDKYNIDKNNNNLIKKEKTEGNNTYFNTAPKDNQKSLISPEDDSNSKDATLKKDMINKEKKEINPTKRSHNNNNKSITKTNTIKDLLRHKSILEKLNETEEESNEKDKNIFNKENNITEEEMKNYLIYLPEEMDYYESLEKDKRSLLAMLLDLIVKKNIIVNTFFISEETEPLAIKIIEFVLFLLINFVSTAALIFPEDILMLYDISIGKYLYKSLLPKAAECFERTRGTIL